MAHNPNVLDNLKSLADRPTKEKKKIARLGGIASAKARAKLKSQREIAMMMLATPSGGTNKAILEKFNIFGEDATLNAELTYKLIEECKKGKEWAFNMLFSMTGQKDSEIIIEKQQQEIEKLKLECEKLRQETNTGSDSYEDLTPLAEKLGFVAIKEDDK